MPLVAKRDLTGCIHHVWLTDGPLPDIAVECLVSYAPARQVLWVGHESGEVAVPRHVPGLSVRLLTQEAAGVSPARVAWLLAKLPVQHVKDEVALQIVSRWGGVFTDLDVISTGHPMPDGHLFVEEVQACDGRKLRKLHITLSIFGAPPADAVIREAAAQIQAHHTEMVSTGKMSRWMWNGACLSAVVGRCDTARLEVRPSVEYMPLPMHTRELPGSVPPTPGAPTIQDMVAKTKTINVWQRQWNPRLQQAALAWAREQRATRESLCARADAKVAVRLRQKGPQASAVAVRRVEPPLAVPPQGAERIRALLRTTMQDFIVPRLGEVVGLRVLADCLEVLDVQPHLWAREPQAATAALMHVCLAFQTQGYYDAETHAETMRAEMSGELKGGAAHKSPVEMARADVLTTLGTSREETVRLALFTLASWQSRSSQPLVHPGS